MMRVSCEERELKEKRGTGGINTRANVIPRYKSRWVLTICRREKEDDSSREERALGQQWV